MHKVGRSRGYTDLHSRFDRRGNWLSSATKVKKLRTSICDLKGGRPFQWNRLPQILIHLLSPVVLVDGQAVGQDCQDYQSTLGLVCT